MNKPMNPAIKAEWIAALRSGEYVQGKDYLRTKGNDDGKVKHCCLGVLCELAVKHGVIGPAVYAGGGAYDFGGTVFKLPPAVMDWAGIESLTAIYGDVPLSDLDACNELTQDNDSGKSFNEIADIIEKEF